MKNKSSSYVYTKIVMFHNFLDELEEYSTNLRWIEKGESSIALPWSRRTKPGWIAHAQC